MSTEIASEKRQPWFKFFPSDWQGDELLVMCSLAARGLLAELVCVMHKAQPYGYLLVNGKRPTDEELARLVRASSKSEVRKLMAELLERGVLSQSDDGAIYSRRMVRKAALSSRNSDNGKLGGNPALRRLSAGLTDQPSEPLSTEVKPQRLDARSQREERPVSLPTNAEVGNRAGAFIEHYAEIYPHWLNGTPYRRQDALEFPTACSLVSTWPDARLRMMAEVFLRTDHKFATEGRRSIKQFAALAEWCDNRLREHGR